MAAREKIKLTSYDELLGVTNDGTEEIEIARLTTFKNHPFKVIEDEEWTALLNQLRKMVFLSPILVRKWMMEIMKSYQDIEEREHVS